MAKRAAAGTLALAVCLTGGLVSATTANAAFTAVTGEATLTGSAPFSGTAAAQTAVSAGVLTATIPGATQDTTATTVTFTLNNGATFAAAGTASVTNAAGVTTTPTPTIAGGVLTVVIPAGAVAGPAPVTVAVTGATITTTANLGNNSRTVVAAVGGTNVTDVTANAALITQPGGDLATTSSTGSTTVAAPQVIKAGAQALADVTISIPASTTASWSTGDRILFALPDGLTFSGTPTITATKVSGDGTTVPTFSAAVPTQTATGAPSAIPLNRQVAFSYTNTEGTTTADNGTSYKLVISGIKADVATTYGSDSVVLGALGGPNAQLYYQAQTASSPQTFAAAVDLNLSSDVLAYVVPASLSVATGSTFVNGGGVQAAPAVTITESTVTSIASGATPVGIRFTDANGTVVPLDSITGAGFVPTLVVNGAAVTSPVFTVNANVLSVSPTFTAAIDTVTIGNVRFAASNTTFVGPLKAELVTPTAAAVNAVPGNTAISAPIQVNIPTNRLGGATRFDTAAQVAATAFPGGSLTRFVLANGSSDGVDALSGNFQAGVGTDAPVVLVQSNGIPSPSLAFIVSKVPAASSTTPQTITFDVIGGEDAVSDTVRNALRAAFPSSSNYTLVFRDNAGDDRYDTAAKVAINAGAANVSSFSGTFGAAAKKTAILTSGLSTADAVTVGGISYKAGFPLLLTRVDTVPASTLSAIQTLGITQVVVVGGTSVVSTAVETQLAGVGVSIIRLSGDDRYATATAVANWARTPVVSTTTTSNAGLGYNGASLTGTTVTHTPTDVLLASGSALADILAAGQLSGRGTGAADYFPVLTTGVSALSTTTLSFITTNKDGIVNVRGIGGADALPASVLTAAGNAAN